MCIFKWSHWDLWRFLHVRTKWPMRSLCICSLLWNLLKQISTFLLDCSQDKRKKMDIIGVWYIVLRIPDMRQRCIIDVGHTAPWIWKFTKFQNHTGNSLTNISSKQVNKSLWKYHSGPGQVGAPSSQVLPPNASEWWSSNEMRYYCIITISIISFINRAGLFVIGFN